jgi:hypothetical protein
MAKRDPTADAISKVAALKSVDDPARLAAELTPLLADKSNYVVARAAALAGERDVRALTPVLIDTFTKLLHGPATRDSGCEAKLALAKALVQVEAGLDAEAIATEGARHAHWEGVYGGSVDLGIGVRGHCAIMLAAMGSKHALRVATELLAEHDINPPPRERASWSVRVDAARALTMTHSEAAGLLLRFKAIDGDDESNVIAECLAGVIAIEREKGVELARRYLNGYSSSRDPRVEAKAEAALTAIGGSRLQSAYEVLREYDQAFLRSPALATYLASIALTRQEPAITYLLGLVAEADKETSAAATHALKPLLALPRVQERLDEALAKR